MIPSDNSPTLDPSRDIFDAGLLSQRATLPRRLGIALVAVLYCWQEPLQMSISVVERALGMHRAPGPHTGLFGVVFVWYLLANTGLVGRGAPHVWSLGHRVSAVLIALCGLAGIFLWYWGTDMVGRWGALYLPLRIANGLCLLGALLRVYWRGPALPVHPRGIADAATQDPS